MGWGRRGVGWGGEGWAGEERGGMGEERGGGETFYPACWMVPMYAAILCMPPYVL